jgi:hypothetical protein
MNTQELLNTTVGHTIKDILIYRDSRIIFVLDNNTSYQMYHYQECCEEVFLDNLDVEELKELIGEKILEFTERISAKAYDTVTYTFYTIRTINRSVTFSWKGSSNGCYSENVDIEKISNEQLEKYRRSF